MSELDLEKLLKKINQLEAELETIKQRNVRVEADKAWEASKFRILFLSVLTYAITAFVFWTIEVPRPMLNALIPTVAYCLSTQSLPFVKRWWIKKQTSSCEN